ncbi:hypothetical protein CHRY9390_00188 [Chryseobacterium aquaeductus]|uniref:Uncharacterized protein n=1 Tax=Chryseobacterium aquaeductus TaxID=2675056 RepID=A0A9N8QR25_9FLAO|nr:hypothetical protein CHRY9390_00188 [Chryseobacterium potabilaquae]CAD7797554.1 hypothetical protein CHRY9390_00188 [Chryseobacterium aquaeductus]
MKYATALLNVDEIIHSTKIKCHEKFIHFKFVHIRIIG